MSGVKYCPLHAAAQPPAEGPAQSVFEPAGLLAGEQASGPTGNATDSNCNDLASLAARSEVAHIGGHVYLSNFFAAKSRRKLTEHGITHILNCTSELPCTFDSEQALSYMQLAIADNPSESLPVEAGLEFVAAAAQAGGRVLVHCAAGGSRSASIVLAWVMQTQHSSYDQALAKVREVRWVEPNLGFEQQLRAREKDEERDPSQAWPV